MALTLSLGAPGAIFSHEKWKDNITIKIVFFNDFFKFCKNSKFYEIFKIFKIKFICIFFKPKVLVKFNEESEFKFRLAKKVNLGQIFFFFWNFDEGDLFKKISNMIQIFRSILQNPFNFESIFMSLGPLFSTMQHCEMVRGGKGWLRTIRGW